MCLSEQLVVLASIVLLLLLLLSSDIGPTGLITGCDLVDSLRGKLVLHGKSNLCVLIEGKLLNVEEEHPANIL